MQFVTVILLYFTFASWKTVMTINLEICDLTKDIHSEGNYVKTLCAVYKSVNYEDARQTCTDAGMHLFVINNPDVQSTIQDVAGNRPGSYERLWVNGMKDNEENWNTFDTKKSSIFHQLKWLDGDDETGECLSIVRYDEHYRMRFQGWDCTGLAYAYCEFINPFSIETFAEFKSIFNKTYVDEAEENFRRSTFLKNLQLISAHNHLYDLQKETYSLAINHFSDWTHSEYLAIMATDLSTLNNDDDDDDDDDDNNFILSNDESNDQTTININKKAKCDCEFDSKNWLKRGAVTPVKNQLNCASSWAFSAVGALEGQFYLNSGVLNSLSVQQLIDCSRKLGNYGCHNGSMDTAFKYIQDFGILTENNYDYEGLDNDCRTSPNSKQVKGVTYIPKGNEDKLKDVVRNVGPVAAALDATDEKFMHYHDGVYFNKDCDSNNTVHSVLVIGYGYDESSELSFWLIKNSFGTMWGNSGYIKVARSEHNHCGIANVASYPVV